MNRPPGKTHPPPYAALAGTVRAEEPSPFPKDATDVVDAQRFQVGGEEAEEAVSQA